MIKKLWNKIKSWFTPKQEIDEHIEFFTKVPEPEIPVHTSEHCKDHTKLVNEFLTEEFVIKKISSNI